MVKMAEKRKADDGVLVAVAPKKTRSDLVISSNRNSQVASSNVARTSNLFAPIMLLEGHEGEVFTLDFHTEGEYLASSGFDRKIYLWSVFGECENLHVYTGHTGAVTQLKFTQDNVISASTDQTLGLWDLVACQRIKKYEGHTTFVNSLSVSRRGPQQFCSGSDDSTVKLWDIRKKQAAASVDAEYQVTAVCFNDTAEQIFSGGIDNEIKVWDVRKNEVLYTLKGHTDTVTGLSLSPDGAYVLSNSIDNTLRIWDIRPYAPQERCLTVLQGPQHNFEKNLIRANWSPDGTRVISGSADRFVYVWDVGTRRVLYKLPGHNGSVNDVSFHPVQPIIASGASDKQIYMGEIDP